MFLDRKSPKPKAPAKVIQHCHYVWMVLGKEAGRIILLKELAQAIPQVVH